jgi:lipopolysaccharide/colanic/teichoic acid biosynthesis glycosyltransferase
MSYISPTSKPDPAQAPVVAARPRVRPYRAGGKRLIDLLLVCLAAPVVLVLLAPLALLVRRDGGPFLYRQQRLGRDGRVFQMLKIRTMVVDADARLAALCAADPALAAEWRVNQKLARDPRITRIGHVLRRTSIDELPQLWNVFRGDMALVGPRPMTVAQGPLYPGTAYYLLRPGVTGPWQVSDRHESSFAARAIYDTDYERELSLAGDLRLLARTVGVVFGCRGA